MSNENVDCEFIQLTKDFEIAKLRVDHKWPEKITVVTNTTKIISLDVIQESYYHSDNFLLEANHNSSSNFTTFKEGGEKL